ncbi:hypothetical protein [Anaerotruncus colihominis]|uniref:hypothetical protein n=1 Tax=Anaerotruncus colihominis TaxID=169435 RepID=UPI00189AA485|nr:hypothetical protein [Anaerotruncus colihominis]
MEAFQMDSKFFYRFLKIKCERETMEYVLREMEEMLGEDQPDAEQVHAYLQAPDEPAALSLHQQMVAMDKLLECAEVNFRTTCDLFRYQQMKKAGGVNTVDEFLRLVHLDESEEVPNEDI